MLAVLPLTTRAQQLLPPQPPLALCLSEADQRAVAVLVMHTLATDGGTLCASRFPGAFPAIEQYSPALAASLTPHLPAAMQQVDAAFMARRAMIAGRLPDLAGQDGIADAVVVQIRMMLVSNLSPDACSFGAQLLGLLGPLPVSAVMLAAPTVLQELSSMSSLPVSIGCAP